MIAGLTTELYIRRALASDAPYVDAVILVSALAWHAAFAVTFCL